MVTFLVGVLAGFAGDRLLVGRDEAWGPPPGPPPGGPLMRGPHGRGMPGPLAGLDLTDAQRATVDSLLEASRPRNEAIMREVMPRLRASADSLQHAIRAVLTPAQQK